MKKMLFTLIAMLTMAVSVQAMSYEQARREALFLTDKMAYELNLTDAQYEAAYEINLDYLMGVTGRHDVFGLYWERRNTDLQFILHTWQWEAYLAASYFYRPLFWEAGYWHFGIYARYPHRDYFYFGRPHFYVTYRGGHSWRMNGGRSYYEHHREHFRPAVPRDNHFGMRDGWNRGDYRSGGGHGNSSTRVTGPSNRGNRGTVDRDGGSRSGNFSGTRNNENRPAVGSGAERSNSRESRPATVDRQVRPADNSSVGSSGSGNFSGSRSSSANSETRTAPVSRARSAESSAPRIENRSAGSRMNSAPTRTVTPSASSASPSSSRISGISRSASPTRSVSASPSRSSSASPTRSASASSSRSASGGQRSGGNIGGSQRGGGRR